jgi:hypothetical protein
VWNLVAGGVLWWGHEVVDRDGMEREVGGAVDKEVGEGDACICRVDVEGGEVLFEVGPAVGNEASAVVGVIAGLFCAFCMGL